MQRYALHKGALSFGGISSKIPVPEFEKPREKMMQRGPSSLSVRELLTAILVTGTTREKIDSMVERIITDYGERNILEETDPSKLSEDLKIPIVKSCQIVACGELGRRFFQKSTREFKAIRTANDAFEYFDDMRSLSKEHLRGLYLNSHNKVIKDSVISIGTVDASLIHPREVFREALQCNASSIILAHNHPSGELEPSEADIEVTNRLIDTSRILGIPVLDHIIIGKHSFTRIKAQYQ